MLRRVVLALVAGLLLSGPVAPPAQAQEGPPDWERHGFSQVMVSRTLDPARPHRIRAGPYTIAVPAGAFRSRVAFEVLAGSPETFAAGAPSGETPLLAFALRVRDIDTGRLISRFAKPIGLVASDNRISRDSKYYNILPDGRFRANPAGLRVKPGELRHPLAGAGAGWVMTVPAPEFASWPFVEPVISVRRGRNAATFVVWAQNNSSEDLTSLEVKIEIPAGARVIKTWAGNPESNPGSNDGAAVGWVSTDVPAGKLQGPFVMQVATGGKRVESHAWLRFKAGTFAGESVSETAPDRSIRPGGASAAPAWETRAPLPEPNSEFAVAQLGHKVYVLGGYPSTRITVPTVQVYDAREDRWELATPLPQLNNHGMAAAVDGKVYLIGGQTTAAGGDAAGFLDTVFEYDPSTKTWTSRAPMPTKRSSGAAVVIDGKIYVAGGRPPHGNEFAVYNPREDTWRTLPDLPTPRNHIAADAIDGKVYVVGGRFGGGFQSEVTDALEVFDPATNTWTSRAPMPTKRGGVNGIAANGCLYVWGGEGQNDDHPLGVFAEHEVYNPITDTWRSLSPMPVPVHGVTGAAFIDGWVHLPGGGTSFGGSSGSTINQVFRPELACG